jgi:hypothetical protein
MRSRLHNLEFCRLLFTEQTKRKEATSLVARLSSWRKSYVDLHQKPMEDQHLTAEPDLVGDAIKRYENFLKELQSKLKIQKVCRLLYDDLRQKEAFINGYAEMYIATLQRENPSVLEKIKSDAKVFIKKEVEVMLQEEFGKKLRDDLRDKGFLKKLRDDKEFKEKYIRDYAGWYVKILPPTNLYDIESVASKTEGLVGEKIDEALSEALKAELQDACKDKTVVVSLRDEQYRREFIRKYAITYRHMFTNKNSSEEQVLKFVKKLVEKVTGEESADVQTRAFTC